MSVGMNACVFSFTGTSIATYVPLPEVDKVVWLSRDLVLMAIPDEHNPSHVHACRWDGQGRGREEMLVRVSTIARA